MGAGLTAGGGDKSRPRFSGRGLDPEERNRLDYIVVVPTHSEAQFGLFAVRMLVLSKLDEF